MESNSQDGQSSTAENKALQPETINNTQSDVIENDHQSPASRDNSPQPSTSAVDPNGKRKKKDKHRRRDPRLLKNVMKNIQSTDDTSKLQSLSIKYSELYEEGQVFQSSLRESEKHRSLLQKERDQLSSDQVKMTLALSRMESLCRELQRQNKLIKEENMTRIREEEERRKAASAKFHATINEVTSLMQESTETHTKLKDDNVDMANKISTLYAEFEKRGQELDKITKQVELEKQLADVQLAKANIECETLKEMLNAEKEAWNTEREYLQCENKNWSDKCNEYQANVKSLQDQINVYTGRYEEFESTITKSSEVFDNCKLEITNMSKQIANLENEIKMWKERYQKSSQAFRELTSDNDTIQKHNAMLERKVDQLTKLSRQIQVERSAYLNALRKAGINPDIDLLVTDNKPILVETQAPPQENNEEPKTENCSEDKNSDHIDGAKSKVHFMFDDEKNLVGVDLSSFTSILSKAQKLVGKMSQMNFQIKPDMFEDLSKLIDGAENIEKKLNLELHKKADDTQCDGVKTEVDVCDNKE